MHQETFPVAIKKKMKGTCKIKMRAVGCCIYYKSYRPTEVVNYEIHFPLLNVHRSLYIEIRSASYYPAN
jgi:hypothetical protein